MFDEGGRHLGAGLSYDADIVFLFQDNPELESSVYGPVDQLFVAPEESYTTKRKNRDIWSQWDGCKEATPGLKINDIHFTRNSAEVLYPRRKAYVPGTWRYSVWVWTLGPWSCARGSRISGRPIHGQLNGRAPNPCGETLQVPASLME